MSEYIIYTDSASDIKPEQLEKWGVYSTSLRFKFDGEENDYSNNDLSAEEFYAKMREGGVAKTSAVNMQTFKENFEKLLNEGKDILYIGFSSGLSGTFNSARLASAELAEKYPERKILTVDSLAASAGQGLLLYLTVCKKNNGATIEEAAEFAENNKMKVCHWFTVDDLVYLKRGGRVSPTVAFVGNVLGIKPVLHVDDEGHLINVSKVRGRKNAIAALADKYGESAEKSDDACVFISHGSCADDANELAAILKSRYGVQVSLITDVGPVIGAHAGPGVLALFFIGNKR